MIKGLFETHLNVLSLERSMNFYANVLGLTLGYLDEERRAAFYWIGERGEAMLGLWEKPAEQVILQHFAFRCELEDVLLRAEKYLADRELKPYNFLKNGDTQPMVFAWMPALAIYFRDPDAHVLEFIAMLPDAPNAALGIVAYEDWQKLN